MDEHNHADFDGEDEEDSETYAQLDELEKLETVIMLMEELGVETLSEARLRFEALERSIESEG